MQECQDKTAKTLLPSGFLALEPGFHFAAKVGKSGNSHFVCRARRFHSIELFFSSRSVALILASCVRKKKGRRQPLPVTEYMYNLGREM
jgi:hypothetical protein